MILFHIISGVKYCIGFEYHWKSFSIFTSEKMLAYESGEQKHRCREFDKQFSNALSEKNMLALIERVAKPRRMWFRWAGKTGTSYPNKIFSKTSFGTWVYLSLWVLLMIRLIWIWWLEALLQGSLVLAWMPAWMNTCMRTDTRAAFVGSTLCSEWSVCWDILWSLADVPGCVDGIDFWFRP